MKNYNHKLNANRQRPKVNGQKLYPQLVDKTISMTRQDIAKMRTAQNAFRNAENPSVWQLYNLYDYILDDATLTSQIENRIQDTLGSSYSNRKEEMLTRNLPILSKIQSYLMKSLPRLLTLVFMVTL